MNTNTYTIDQLQRMTNTLNIMSNKLFHRNSIWRLEIQQKHTCLKRIAYIYSKTVGSIEFLETETESGEFKFTVIDPVNEFVGYSDIYDAAKYLKLV